MEESGIQTAVPRERLVKYFGYLILIRMVSAALSLFSLVPYVGGFAEYISPVLTIGKIWILVNLGNRDNSYSKATMLLMIAAVIEMVSVFSPLMGLPNVLGEFYHVFATGLTLASSICSFMAMYQEYNAHAELIVPINQELAGKWHKLFNWQIVFLLVSYVINFVLVAVFFLFPVAMQIYVLAVKLVNLVFAWLYIQNLNGMCKCL